MSEEIDLRKIAISKETFEKLSEEFIERLKNEEKINLVILDKAVMHPKNLSHLDVSGVIMVQDEVDRYQKELELISPEMLDNETLAKQFKERSKVFEMQNVPEIIEDYRRVYERPKQLEEMNKVFEMKNVPEVIVEDRRIYQEPKQKYYVPRTIGKPNSKKKGGR